MGNTDTFAALSTNIVLCPKDMTPTQVFGDDGVTPLYTGVKLDISNLECTTENAIEAVECENWEVVCESGNHFFFRLATFGEVYELATKV
jgi:hypothetical protein